VVPNPSSYDAPEDHVDDPDHESGKGSKCSAQRHQDSANSTIARPTEAEQTSDESEERGNRMEDQNLSERMKCFRAQCVIPAEG
jgi:hypothetical protein